MATGAPIAALAIEEQVKELAARRAVFATADAALKSRESAFYDSIRQETDAVALLKQQVETLELSIKASAEQMYRETGELKPCVGVVVKEFTVFDYPKADADAWTKEKGLARIPEQMDVKAFEKIAKATPLPFVTQSKEGRAQINRDLSQVLA
jgi:hypothetical protein